MTATATGASRPDDNRLHPAPPPEDHPTHLLLTRLSPTREPRLPLGDPIALCALLHTAALAVAATVAVTPGAAATVRGLLALQLPPPSGTARDAAALLAHNLLVLAPLLLAPPVLRTLPSVRPLICAYAAWQALATTGTVGAALGAHGPWLLPLLVHVPLEWAALALAVAQLRQPRLRVATPLACLALLVAAAVLETWGANF